MLKEEKATEQIFPLIIVSHLKLTMIEIDFPLRQESAVRVRQSLPDGVRLQGTDYREQAQLIQISDRDFQLNRL